MFLTLWNFFNEIRSGVLKATVLLVKFRVIFVKHKFIFCFGGFLGKEVFDSFEKFERKMFEGV